MSGKQTSNNRRGSGRKQERRNNNDKDYRIDASRTNECGSSRTNNRRVNRKDAAGNNDPAWYATDPALLRDAASIPFSWASGTPINVGGFGGVEVAKWNFSDAKYTMPGIQVQTLKPSVGFALDPTAPINIAANATYAFVVHANSRNTSYNAPDLMQYIMAMSQVYAFISFCQRAYGVATLYAQGNRYLPDALLRVMSIDPDDVRNHLADFRYGINLLINKAASFAVPATMPFFSRQAMLYSNIYTGGTSIKDQLYLYTPDSFWRFNVDSTKAGELQDVVWDTWGESINPVLYTVDKILEFGSALLEPLISSEDMNVMSGDILKAYGANNIIKLVPLDTSYPIVPIYNPMVLEQMKNATVVGDFKSGSNNVSQEPVAKGWLVSTPSVAADSTAPDTAAKQLYRLPFYSENKILTTAIAEPTPEVVMENTRLMAGLYDIVETEGSGAAFGRLLCGSEIVVGCYFLTREIDDAGTISDYKFKAYYINTSAIPINAAAQDAFAYQFGILSNFKYHPAFMYAAYSGSTPTFSNKYPKNKNFDVDNYAILDNDTIAKLHETALMSMLHVPSIAKLA